MSGELTVTMIGNLVRDPEMRVTQSGKSVTNFTIAQTSRQWDKGRGEFVEGTTVFMNCTAWQDLGEHVNGSLAKGDRVIATGRITQRDWEKDGVKRTATELVVDEIGPSLRWATAKVSRVEKGQRSAATQADEPPANYDDDPPPF